MKIVIFCHSLRACWNHGNAHFLRGAVSELIERGNDVQVYEARGAWSLENQQAEASSAQVEAEFHVTYPRLSSHEYTLETLDLDRVLEAADLVLVHEWNTHPLVAQVGEHRRTRGGYTLLFHDTHHRGVSQPYTMWGYDLRFYDGVLAFGNVLRDLYLQNGWTERAFTWHEAADPRVFHPLPDVEKTGDLVWVGNWGDEERTQELHEFLLDPVKRLHLAATVHGVGYPPEGKVALADAGITYGGWLPNFRAPYAFAQHRVTVHVPRRFYTEQLPGIPTIRMFEALACGIPLVSAPWEDAEHLFTPGQDFLFARSGDEMTAHLQRLLREPEYAQRIAESGRQTILARHTCAHRVDELLGIVQELQAETRQ